MHGKGGAPNSRPIAPFAAALERNGFLVANLDMPWSGARNYDVDVAAGERQVQEADGDGYYIRGGIIVVPKGASIPDGTIV